MTEQGSDRRTKAELLAHINKLADELADVKVRAMELERWMNDDSRGIWVEVNIPTSAHQGHDTVRRYRWSPDDIWERRTGMSAVHRRLVANLLYQVADELSKPSTESIVNQVLDELDVGGPTDALQQWLRSRPYDRDAGYRTPPTTKGYGHD